MPTRRTFLTASLAAALSSGSAAGLSSTRVRRGPICVFTKPFNSLTFEQLAEKVAALGFDGIEAPVRAGGHIEPADVPDRLPELIQALSARQLRMTVMTTDINDPRDPLTETVLRTAAGLGVRHYRMKYFRYDESKSITGQIDEWKAQLTDLAAMNKELGITAVYQNHAGRNVFGASIWDLHRALDGIAPQQVGVAYDIRHATVEGGMSWPVGFRLIQPHIQAVYVKDFVWGDSKPTNVPLGRGRVSPEFFRMFAEPGFAGPISLHEEYLDHRDPALVPKHLEAIDRDFQTLKSWLKAEAV